MRRQINKFLLPTANCQLPTANCQLPTVFPTTESHRGIHWVARRGFYGNQAANREVLPPPADKICTLCCLFAVGVVRMTGYIFNSGRRIRPIAARHVALRRRSCPPSRHAKSIVRSRALLVMAPAHPTFFLPTADSWKLTDRATLWFNTDELSGSINSLQAFCYNFPFFAWNTQAQIITKAPIHEKHRNQPKNRFYSSTVQQFYNLTLLRL